MCNELTRRGYSAIHGDRVLAFQGDPESGESVQGITGPAVHRHHVWKVDDVRALAADQREPVTFFCGGSRNFVKFIDLFDGIFVLEVDTETLNSRLDVRSKDEWGGLPAERELILQLQSTREDIPRGGISIDATAPIEHVVDEILRLAQAGE